MSKASKEQIDALVNVGLFIGAYMKGLLDSGLSMEVAIKLTSELQKNVISQQQQNLSGSLEGTGTPFSA